MMKADGFFRDLFDTGLEPGEILVAIHIPMFGDNDRCVFHELARAAAITPWWAPAFRERSMATG